MFSTAISPSTAARSVSPASREAGHGHHPKESSRSLDKIKANVEANAFRQPPKWLEYDVSNMIAKVTAAPAREDIDLPIEEHLIVELYSK